MAKPVGIKRKRGTVDITIPDFQLAPDAVPGIAQVIVNSWTGDPSVAHILERDTVHGSATEGMATPRAVQEATNAINAAAPRYNFTRCVIISEEEHDNGYMTQFPDDVVFVLPSAGRINSAGPYLLSSAKLLMACTPNGI